MHYFFARSPLQRMAKIYWYLVNKFQNFFKDIAIKPVYRTSLHVYATRMI